MRLLAEAHELAAAVDDDVVRVDAVEPRRRSRADERRLREQTSRLRAQRRVRGQPSPRPAGRARGRRRTCGCRGCAGSATSSTVLGNRAARVRLEVRRDGRCPCARAAATTAGRRASSAEPRPHHETAISSTPAVCMLVHLRRRSRAGRTTSRCRAPGSTPTRCRSAACGRAATSAGSAVVSRGAVPGVVERRHARRCLRETGRQSAARARTIERRRMTEGWRDHHPPIGGRQWAVRLIPDAYRGPPNEGCRVTRYWPIPCAKWNLRQSGASATSSSSGIWSRRSSSSRRSTEQRVTGGKLGEILVELGFITRVELAGAISEQWDDLRRSRRVDARTPKTNGHAARRAPGFRAVDERALRCGAARGIDRRARGTRPAHRPAGRDDRARCWRVTELDSRRGVARSCSRPRR